jgi:hypothetical protein
MASKKAATKKPNTNTPVKVVKKAARKVITKKK